MLTNSCAMRASFSPFGERLLVSYPQIDNSTNSIHIDRSKCVMCQGCVSACKRVSGTNSLKVGKDQAGKEIIIISNGTLLSESPCIKCGQCTLQCPVGAITERDQSKEVMAILSNPGERVCVAQTAPAIRVSLSEAFGLPPGTVSTGKMVTALKRLGFKYVFDTNWGADLTIMEEATELVQRITTKGSTLPMFTSCCPAWINYVEQTHPELIPNLSSCRSPMSMLSSILKTEFAKSKGVGPQQIFNVGIMPCTAKKDEIERKQLVQKDGTKDTDYVLTVRELIRMIKSAKIDFKNLPDTPFDVCYGQSSGAGAIFGATGGVMEAAVRTAYELISGKKMEALELIPVRGIKDGIKIASLEIAGKSVKVGVAHGMANAEKLIKKIAKKDPEVDGLTFVEVMACPGGCVCGGGTTKPKTKKIMEKRLEGIYSIDKKSVIRRSHENPEIKALYASSLGKPNSHKAHELLHTEYHSRKK